MLMLASSFMLTLVCNAALHAARAHFSGLTCLLTQDGMDQSKWALPRCRGGIQTKTLAKFDRPRTKIEGIWCHNVIMTLHVIDVRVAGDASMVAECLSRDLEKVVRICRELGKEPPRRILLWVSLLAFS